MTTIESYIIESDSEEDDNREAHTVDLRTCDGCGAPIGWHLDDADEDGPRGTFFTYKVTGTIRQCEDCWT